MNNTLLSLINTICLLILLGACERGSAPDKSISSCTDGLLNGDEIGIDCGGSCPQSCSEVFNIPTQGYEAPENYPGYSLVWEDHFDGENLDLQNWSYHLGNGCPNLCNWGNNEWQTFTDQSKNIRNQDGYLIITAIQEFLDGHHYTSARIHTDNKLEFKYARIDIRASMPSAKGTWVALWLLNQQYSIFDPARYWPSGGEIDIMEYLGEKPEEIFGTAHFGNSLTEHRFNSGYISANDSFFDEAFNVFSIIWEEDRIQWLLNDQVYHEINRSYVESLGQNYPFNDDFFLVFSLSVGGNLPADPVVAEYPSSLIIDYVKVFQKN